MARYYVFGWDDYEGRPLKATKNDEPTEEDVIVHHVEADSQDEAIRKTQEQADVPKTGYLWVAVHSKNSTPKFVSEHDGKKKVLKD